RRRFTKNTALVREPFLLDAELPQCLLDHKPARIRLHEQDRIGYTSAQLEDGRLEGANASSLQVPSGVLYIQLFQTYIITEIFSNYLRFVFSSLNKYIQIY